MYIIHFFSNLRNDLYGMIDVTLVTFNTGYPLTRPHHFAHLTAQQCAVKCAIWRRISSPLRKYNVVVQRFDTVCEQSQCLDMFTLQYSPCNAYSLDAITVR